MAVVKALRQVPGALGRNPVLFAVLGAFGLLQAPQLLAQTVDPLLASLVSLVLTGLYIFLVPFVQAGLVGMADEALDGRTEFGTFLRAGKQFYLSVLGAYLAIFALSFALGIVAAIVAVLGGVVAFAGDASSAVTLVVFGVVMLVVLVPYLLVVFFVQFYGQRIVLDGASAIGGLKGSVGLVRRNLISTLGYTLVVVVVSGTLGAGSALVSVALQSGPGFGAGTSAGATPAMGPTLSLPAALGLVVLYVVGTALVGGVLLTYSVAFYREIRGPVGRAETEPRADHL